ncbi:hypothetical protein [Micromonospora chersina]|uniref:hypothetical protein n=1 Tax=Micromonospora chersina TaxID=47854 RepID=UPI0037159E95
MDAPLAIRARGITKCFGDVIALDGVDLDVAQASLTAGLATPPACGVDTPAPQNPLAAAVPSAGVPADKQQLAAKWDEWKSHQWLTGPDAKPDYANPAQMNHFTWYQSHEWKKPYPGEDKIFAPEDVPGAYIPSPESDG